MNVLVFIWLALKEKRKCWFFSFRAQFFSRIWKFHCRFNSSPSSLKCSFPFKAHGRVTLLPKKARLGNVIFKLKNQSIENYFMFFKICLHSSNGIKLKRWPQSNLIWWIKMKTLDANSTLSRREAGKHQKPIEIWDDRLKRVEIWIDNKRPVPLQSIR